MVLTFIVNLLSNIHGVTSKPATDRLLKKLVHLTLEFHLLLNVKL